MERIAKGAKCGAKHNSSFLDAFFMRNNLFEVESKETNIRKNPGHANPQL